MKEWPDTWRGVTKRSAVMQHLVKTPCEKKLVSTLCPQLAADPEGKGPLESIKMRAPLEIVCIDFWYLITYKIGTSVPLLQSVCKTSSKTSAGKIFLYLWIPQDN